MMNPGLPHRLSNRCAIVVTRRNRRYVWLTPHGLGFLVDHRGTRPIDPDHARQIPDAGDHIERYFPDPPLHVELAFSH